MIPPEPGPDPPEPPEPTVPTYTYDEKTTYFGTKHLYTYIRSEGLLVNVITSYHPEYAVFSDLFEVNGTRYPAYAPTGDYIYYLNGSGKVIRYNRSINTEMDWDTYTITSESPTGYTAAIFSGEYDFEQYQH